MYSDILPGPLRPTLRGEVDQVWGELVLGVVTECKVATHFFWSNFEGKGHIA